MEHEADGEIDARKVWEETKIELISQRETFVKKYESCPAASKVVWQVMIDRNTEDLRRGEEMFKASLNSEGQPDLARLSKSMVVQPDLARLSRSIIHD